MRWADRILLKGSSPVTGARVGPPPRQGRVIVAASASKPRRPPRVVVVVDEVDPPDHQSVPITTR